MEPFNKVFNWLFTENEVAARYLFNHAGDTAKRVNQSYYLYQEYISIIDKSFVWDEQPQGHSYWKDFKDKEMDLKMSGYFGVISDS